jgi:hypothetical protein
MASASSFFSLAFSLSRPRNPLGLGDLGPPYLAFELWKLASLTRVCGVDRPFHPGLVLLQVTMSMLGKV